MDNRKNIIINREVIYGKRRKLIKMLVDGYKGREIAEELHISLSSVKKHISSLKAELGCDTLHELCVYMGLIYELEGCFEIKRVGNSYVIDKRLYCINI